MSTLSTPFPFRPTKTTWWIVASVAVVSAVVALGWLGIVRTAGKESLVSTARLRSDQAVDLTKALSRTATTADGVEAEIILATPDFFRLTGRTAEGARLGADKSIVFVANESVHYGEMPKSFAPILRIDGTRVVLPTKTDALVDAVHHRTTVVVFGDVGVAALGESHTYEMLVTRPTGEVVVLPWSSPLDYPDSVDMPRGLSLGLLLTLAAGLLASISPCLLQLTAYYVPTLAGVSADAGAGAGGIQLTDARRRILGTAVLFVLGFTVPYTIGGAVMGGAGQALVKSGILTPTGPLAIAAGTIMILVAAVVAHRARAPLVCKMPMPIAMRRSTRLPLVTTFVAGFAMATGCLACFGGAILGVLLVYTGLLGSAPLGALAMFVFSLGIAVPFLLAALGFSHVLSWTAKLQRYTPAMGLASSLLMLFFGVTMVTGNFHVVSGWLVQHLPFL